VYNLYLWEKENVVRYSFFTGMTIAFLGSLNPWFMWPLGIFYIIVSSMLFALSMSVSFSMSKPYYDRYDFIVPTLLIIILVFYQTFIRNRELNGYIANVFHIIIFFTIFRVSLGELRKFCDFLSKLMGGFLLVSMFFYLLYLAGFPLPSRDAHFLTTYSYSNYYFFLLDDRDIFTIIPRFHSVFLEPGHMGTMTVMLLFTQIGKWKEWYNISLIVATLISFSLAAYGLFIGVIFLGVWVRGKDVIKKAVYAIGLLAVISVGSFYYNNGNNLLHDLIMIRLEVDDGELAGDNRVTGNFEADFESLMSSSDALWGRDRNTDLFGNSGFRVFIYDYGLVGLFLVIAFYLMAMYNPYSARAMTAAFIIASLNFIIRGYPLWYANFIPIYCVAKCAFDSRNLLIETKKETEPYEAY
jgi:hypothetical protein